LAPILTIQSGSPFNIVLATANTTGAGNTIRPNLVGPVQISGDPAQWISNASTALAAPAPNTFGNLGRNAFYGPGFSNLDLALIKNTKITERVNVQFRTDAFDLFNHPNFGNPGGVNGFVVFPASTITSTRFPTADSGSSRQLQLALKLQF
jgi:hypothetical protein